MLKELAALRAKRELQADLAEQRASRPSTARNSRPSTAREQAPLAQDVPSGEGQVQLPKPSLADAILARAEEAEQAEDTIDQEIEEMDRQLKLQVEEFRKQQRRDSQVQDLENEAIQTEQPESMGLTKEGFQPSEPNEIAEDSLVEDSELKQLKHLAAKMDAAFPEFPADAAGVSAAVPAVLGHYQEPDGLPLDDEMSQCKSALEHLDVRLRALQSKKDGLGRGEYWSSVTTFFCVFFHFDHLFFAPLGGSSCLRRAAGRQSLACHRRVADPEPGRWTGRWVGGKRGSDESGAL